MVNKISHLGIAVKDLDAVVKMYEEMLGVKASGFEEVEEQKVKVAFLPVGETRIEFLQSTSPDGPIARYIEKKGEGIQHIAFEVDDLEAELQRLKESGVRLIDETPRKGAGGHQIAFVHPKSTNGILIELCDKGGH